MRNFYTLLLSGLLLCLASSLTAQDEIGIGLTDVSGGVGETVCIDLVGENFVAISGMQFSIIFDTTFLEFVSATGNIGGTNVSMVNRDNAPTVIRVVYSPFSSTGYTDPGPFTIGSICFRIRRLGETMVTIEDAPTPLEFTNDQQMTFGPDDVNVTNGTINMSNGGGANCNDGVQNGNETGVDCGGPDCAACPTCNDGMQNGGETGVDCGGPDCAACPTCTDGIQNGDETGVDCGGSCQDCDTGGGGCGEGSDRLNLCVGEACDVAVGAEVCLDITASNFNSITGFQFDLNYDGAGLDFASFTAAPRFGDNIQSNERSDGSVRILLFDGSGVGISILDNDPIGTICFTNERNEATIITPVGLNFSAVSGNVVGPIGNPGSVNACGGTTPTCNDGVQNGNETGVDCGGDCMPCDGGGDDTCGEGSDRLNICFGDACDVANGAQACLPITTSNFTNITGFQFDVVYPGANLEYVSFTPNSVFGARIQENERSDGEVRLLFFDDSGVGVSLTDNDPIGTICFTNQTAGETTVTATGLNFGATTGNLLGPIANPGSVNGCTTGPTCADGIQNGDETGVDCGGSCAACPTTPCGDGTTDVEVCIGSECADAGAEVCVPIMVGNFDNLTGLQFFLEFTPGNLEFTRFTAHPSLTLGTQITPPLMDGQPVDGVLRALWNDPGLTGVSLGAEEVAFEICFTVENVAATPITFQDPATRLRAFGLTGGALPIRSSPGAVNQNCGNTPSCSDGIQNGDETGIDCGGSCQPCETGGVTCGENSDRLNICAGNACDVDVNGQACIDLTVSMFTGITGFQFNLVYPAANLNFMSFTPNAAFGTRLQNNPVSDGELRFLFFDDAQVGITLDDGASLGTVCFTNEVADATVVTIENLNVGATTGNVIGPIGNAGTINGPDCGMTGPSCTNGIKDGNEVGVDCGGDCPTVCPTCDDGIQNGDETGVDCGGSCAPCPSNMLTLSAGSGMAQIGQQVCVDVTVADFVNIANVGLTLNYNATVLTLASVTASSALPGFGAGNFNTATTGQVTVNYNPTTAQTLANGEAFFEICFNVVAGDESALTITNATATNSGGSNLMVTTNSGTINAGGVVTYDELTLVAANVTGAEGTEVCVDVSVFNLTGLAALQFAIGYDPTKLQFSSAMGTGELPGLQASNPTPGIVRALWFDPNVGSNSVDDGASIVSVCFTVLQACEATIEITEQAPQFRIRATDANNMSVTPIDRVDGSVNAGVSCGGGGTPDNLLLEVGAADGTVGTEVCIDVDATNFVSLTDLAFSLTYDPAKVTFTRATNFGLASITATNVTVSPPGTIAFDWDSPTSTGQSLPNGATVFSLCFTVNQFSVTPVNFSNMPVAIQARNASNQNVGVVPSGGSINPNAPEVSMMTFQIGSASAQTGEEICLPIIGFLAEDLVSFQFSINFDPDVLEYLGPGPNFAFNGLSAGSIQNLQPGVLTVAWADPFANPNSVQDGEAIFSICFRVKETSLTLVTFSNTPTPIEFEDVNTIVSPDLLNGQVNGSPAPVIVDVDLDRPSCFGDNDGSISLTVSGGSNLTYTWSPNVSTSRTATGLTAGTYAVTVTNMTTGQSTSDELVLTDGSVFALEVGSVSGVTCFGDDDGQINLTPVNAEGSVLYDWNGSLPDGNRLQQMLPGGSYSVTATDGNGCRRSLTNIMVGEPAEALRIIGVPVNIPANGSGGVTVEVVGGREPYGYAWSSPDNGYTSDEEDIDDVTMPGTYCLTVSDNNDCTDVQCFAVVQALGTAVSVDRGCADENDASIDLTVTGATGGYTYRWMGPNGFTATTPDLDNLAPGDYNVTVTSGMEEDILTITVEPATPIDLTNVVVTSATSGNNGSITLTPVGGNSPYTYRWDDGSTAQNRIGLPNGQYCVTVTDNSDCTEEACFTVAADVASILSISTTPTQCSDSDDGTIDLVINNGVPPFRVRVTPGTTDESFDTPNISVNSAIGAYMVFVTDAQGAMLDTTITVSGPDPIAVTGSVTSDTEDQDCSGMIRLQITGGTGPYSVAWSNGSTGAAIAQLCLGEYTPTITDANDCMVAGPTFTVGRVDEELESITEVACADGTEGAILVTVSGGVMPYDFAWRSAGSETIIATTEDLVASSVTGGVAAGDYTLTITDATGAVLVKNYTVGISAGFSATVDVTTDYNGFGVSCPGAADGRIVIDISGQGDFMYEFVLNNEMVGVDSILENAGAGTYNVAVIDAGGCEINRTIVITEPTPIALNATLSDISCGSTADGAISVSPTGGVPSYSIAWSTGETTPRVSGLATGDYTVTVTDDNSCTAVGEFALNAPEDLAITFEATDATDGCNGTIRIIPLGGSGNYRFTWPELPNQGNDPLAEGICPGDYTIQVTDDNECQTVTMVATVLDRRFPCLSAREVITPNGDGLNEKFVIFCSDGGEANNNNLQVFNRWGQRVYNVNNYDCSSDDRGTNCFEGRTNDGEILPEGPYYYIFEFTNPQGEAMQQRGSITLLRE